MIISASGIGVKRGDATILESVHAVSRPKEMVGLIGPNGAGKSTLIEVMAGLRKPDLGHVFYDGRLAASVPRRRLARRLAYLEQGAKVDWPLSVEKIVALGRLPHAGVFSARNRQADDTAVGSAMRAADVEGFAQRAFTSLSGGERARVLLARALAVEAEILLADEPVDALDPLHQLNVMELLRRTADGGTGVVVVLHDLTLASRFCDRLILLHRGRVAAEGAPDEVLTDRIVAQCYGVRSLSGTHGGRRFIVPWRRASGSWSEPSEEETEPEIANGHGRVVPFTAAPSRPMLDS
ncbi:ABC transporter ATP-binding protein [Afifella pfennigii]|uniref:ABC transporter ATP-binding protein n=1 Tax=Afifella pfennigii TaxID=209897 RepID=UPI0009FCDDC3|nr:ATP-binding cassette domain-containing protein [Afifella pfennigii]